MSPDGFSSSGNVWSNLRDVRCTNQNQKTDHLYILRDLSDFAGRINVSEWLWSKSLPKGTFYLAGLVRFPNPLATDIHGRCGTWQGSSKKTAWVSLLHTLVENFKMKDVTTNIVHIKWPHIFATPIGQCQLLPQYFPAEECTRINYALHRMLSSLLIF